jgi:hypothetical protein
MFESEWSSLMNFSAFFFPYFLPAAKWIDFPNFIKLTFPVESSNLIVLDIFLLHNKV